MYKSNNELNSEEHEYLVSLYGNINGVETHMDCNGSYFIKSLCKIMRQNVREPVRNWNLKHIMSLTKEF